jgi:hypothetical protein
MVSYSSIFALDKSFRANFGKDGFTRDLYNSYAPNPMGRITKVLLHRVVEGTAISYPDGCTEDAIKQFDYRSGYYQESRVSGLQGAELAYLGQQLLKLDESGKIMPPLADTEIAEISHFVTTVATKDPEFQQAVVARGVTDR